jgi:WD40 repeat protein
LERIDYYFQDQDGTIKVLDANNNYCIRTFDTDGFFTKFLFVKNGYFAAVIDKSKINIWDSVSFQCINTLENDRLTYFLSYLTIIESYLMRMMEIF